MQIDKHSKFSEWYNTITKDAELCDLRYNLKGFIVFMPWAVMSMKRMYSIYEYELEMHGHVPALFPALIPESNFKGEKEHVKGFIPEVFWVTEAGGEKLEERYAMRPTSETAMYPMYALWIQGLKDLPLKIYQSCQVWRHETKATKPFIRSREFWWIEAHDVFATEKEAFAQVKEDMEVAEKIIHGVFGIPFLFFKRPQWDKFAGAVDTYAADCIMPDGRALQLPSTHMLGQHFSKAFGVKYMDAEGKEQYAWQTTYGPCISRIYAAVISIHGDDKGLVLPFELAPIQAVIVPIYKAENKKIIDVECARVENLLRDNGVRVKFDNSENTPGFKFNHWEMKGVPLRVDIGERDIANKSVVLVRRDTREKKNVPVSELIENINQSAKDVSKSIRDKADAWFKGKINSATTMNELNSVLESAGGFVRVPFCTDAMDGEKCADKVKEETHSNMRGSLFEEKESGKDGKNKPKDSEKCIACGKKAKIYLYAARQY